MIQHVIGHLISRLLDSRLKREALVVEEAELGPWRLRYPGLFRLTWTLMSTLWVVATVGLVAVWGGARHEPGILTVVPLFGGLAIFSIRNARDAFFQEIEVSAWGISEVRGGAIGSSFPWQSVREIRLITWLDSYRVSPVSGTPICFVKHIQGIARFKKCALRYAPPGAITSVRERLTRPDSL